MRLPKLPPRLAVAYRKARKMREAGTAKATVNTRLTGKGLSSAELTQVMASVRA